MSAKFRYLKENINTVSFSKLKMMAKKAGSRTVYKEVSNHKKNHDTVTDEIALRDEILRLKRELMALKRTNEQYLVKLRKYEDEAKRKDKQVEQLMDPRKNADITKVLSTKGAAILMNLKDQNEALIQMILNKDLQIRRLVAEIKMSKLYATTRKNESYRTEINRLRNLLIKSQEALKGSDEHQSEKTICASGNSFLEFSSSSDQSSPRDLDELRVTILSLESHIKHSNDLLAKKNQEISLLSNELNFLKKFLRYKTYKNKAFESDGDESKNIKFSTGNFTSKWSDPSTKIFTPEPLGRSEKNQPDDSLPHTAPTLCSNWFTSIEYSPKYSSHQNLQNSALSQEKENRPDENAESLVNVKTYEENSEKIAPLGKSLFHNLAANEILKEEKTSQPRTTRTKEKWVKALYNYRIFKKVKPEMFAGFRQTEKVHNDTENVGKFQSMEDSNIETAEKFNQAKPQDLLESSVTEDTTTATPLNSSNIEELKTCQNSAESSNKNEYTFATNSSFGGETPYFKEQPQDEEKRTEDVIENIGKTENNCNFIEVEKSEVKSLKEISYRSHTSSFDSDSTNSIKQEFRQMKVEVEINTVSIENDGDQSGSSISDSNLMFEFGRESGGNGAPDLLDFNDDDDVIVREK